MKTRLLLIIAAVVLLPLGWAGAQTAYFPPDSCLKLYWRTYDSTFYNTDSVKVDSCYGSSTYNEFYCDKFFYNGYTYNIIPRAGIYPKDTIIEYTLDDIDTRYPDTKEGFKKLVQVYGNFWFREYIPDKPDTSECVKRFLLLRFENYVNIDSVEKFVRHIPLVEISWYMKRYGVWASSKDSLYIETNKRILIYPNPALNELFIKIDENLHMYNNIEIISSVGNVILKESINDSRIIRFNVESLTSGIYFIKIGQIVKPIIIIH